MLLSIALIMTLGMFFGWLCKKARIPGLFGMIVTGILLGPQVLNLVNDSILQISGDLRRIALLIILLRAGLSLRMEDLKKVGRPAVLMCFVPACFEIAGMLLLAPRLLGISLLDAAIMGAVVGAVSPAVIVPKMIRLMEEGYGTEKGIPQLILVGASVDDVFVIVLFSTFTGLAQGTGASAMEFVQIPLSIVSGIAVGLLAGWIMGEYFEKVHVRDTVKIILLLSLSFFMVTAEDVYGEIIPFASLIGVMCVGISLQKKRKEATIRLSEKLNKLWVAAEVLLFVLLGTMVDLESAKSAGPAVILLLAGVLLFRMAGVWISLFATKLNQKERLFCMLAYLPKATVQAAIGGLPLAMGLPCGTIVLTVSVAAILITAPMGAFLIDLTYQRLLTAAAESSWRERSQEETGTANTKQ